MALPVTTRNSHFTFNANKKGPAFARPFLMMALPYASDSRFDRSVVT